MNRNLARRSMLSAISMFMVLGLLGTLAVPVLAAQGDLDPTFGIGGKVITDFNNSDDRIQAIAIQADGKLIAVGSSGLSGFDFALARYNQDGSLDTSFGIGGKVATNFGHTERGYAVAIQSDGKYIVAGNISYTNSLVLPDFALARYNQDGSLDSSFGTNGFVTTDFNGNQDYIRDLAIQSDGKILAAGHTISSKGDFAMARYNQDGSLDTSFGSGGKVTTDFNGGHDVGFTVAIQNDGKIVMGGWAWTIYTYHDFALARYNQDGSLDVSFGNNGRVTTGFSIYDYYGDVIYDIVIQNDGKIVAAGSIWTSPQNVHDFGVVRYCQNGSLDTSFGTGGVATYNFGGSDSANAVSIQKNGKIVVAGGTSYDFALLRYNEDGNLDSTFGTGGQVITDYGSYDTAYDIAIETDGGIVVGGYAFSSTASADFALARYEGASTNTPPEIRVEVANEMVYEGEIAFNSGTVNDADGDTIALHTSVGDVINNGDGTWSWNLLTSDGPTQSQTVTITADDGNGGTDQVSFDLIVNNVVPSVSNVLVPVEPVNINYQTINVSGGFSDPAGSADEPYICTFDYGDGNGPQMGNVSGTSCIGSGHVYEVPGVYAVTATVTDKDGASGSATASNFIVVYDPEGGFVTGGGWIWSPVGAYMANPMLEGKATFGFVSKYLKGANIPSGNTEFQFKTSDLNFKSTNYQWLVINQNGTNAQFKGYGTINGVGNYGFMIWATDGSPDTFRIKIWDATDETIIIYDNGVSQPIGGGSIVIHTK